MKHDTNDSVLRSPLFRLLLLLSILGAFACTVGEFEPDERYSCSTDSDCVSNFFCQTEGDLAGTCRPVDERVDCDDKDGDLAFAGPNCVTVKVEDQDCDDGDATNFPGNAESCDGKDNNCNDEVDEGVAPIACPKNAEGVCAVTAPTYACINGVQDEALCLVGCDALGSMTCPYGDQFVMTENEASGACGDGVDNDCSGASDTADSKCPQCVQGEACTVDGCTGLVGASAANCACFGPATRDCSMGGSGLCLDAGSNEVPRAFDNDEIPGNGIDDNCNGQIDE